MSALKRERTIDDRRRATALFWIDVSQRWVPPSVSKWVQGEIADADMASASAGWGDSSALAAALPAIANTIAQARWVAEARAHDLAIVKAMYRRLARRAKWLCGTVRSSATRLQEAGEADGADVKEVLDEVDIVENTLRSEERIIPPEDKPPPAQGASPQCGSRHPDHGDECHKFRGEHVEHRNLSTGRSWAAGGAHR